MPSKFWDDDAKAPGSSGFWEQDASPIVAPSTPMIQQIGEGAVAFATRPLGEQIPVLGPLAAKAGRAVGAGVGSLIEDRSFSDIYRSMEEEDAREEKTFVKKHPVAAATQSIFGASLLPIKGLGTAKAITSTSRLAGAAKGALGVLDNVLPQAATAYLDAGIRTLDEDKAQTAGESAGEWAVGLQLAPKVLAKLGRGATRLFTGIKGDTIDKYKARKAQINAISEEEAMDQVEEAANAVRSRGEGLVSGAQNSARDAKESAIIEAQNRRQAAIDKARHAETSGISKADEITRTVADDLVQGVRGAQKQVSKASGEAFEVLQQAGVGIPKAQVGGAFDARIKGLEINGVLPDTPEVRVLQKYKGYLSQMEGDNIPPVELKKFVQLMDNEIDDAYAKLQHGERLSSGERALVHARQGVNDQLKEGVPGYADAMQPVAQKTGTLSNLRDSIPVQSGDTAFPRLKNIYKPNSIDKQKALQGYEEEFGGNYLGRLKEAEGMRGRNYMDDAQAEIRRADEHMSQDFGGYFADDIAEGKRLQEVAGSFGRNSDQQTLRRFGNSPDKNIKLGQKFDALEEETRAINPQSTFNPRQMADDLAVKRALSTTHSEGSRNVNLGAISAAGIMRWAGGAVEGIPGFAAVGALIGAAADRGGPQAVKKILDALDHPAARKIAETYSAALNRLPVGAAAADVRLTEGGL